MTHAIYLVEELRDKGGLLGLLKSIKDELNKYVEEAKKVWYEAFKTHREIAIENFGRYYAVFKAIYTRARPTRKRALLPYLKRFEELWNKFKNLREKLNITLLDRLIERGEIIYSSDKGAYKRFLEALHTWIADVYRYVEDYVKKVLPAHDIVRFYNIMIHTYVDVTIDYVGGKRRNIEFVFSSFIHIENYMHMTTIMVEEMELDIPIAVLRVLGEIMPSLLDEVGYGHLFPFSNLWVGGDWDVDITAGPNVESYVASRMVKPYIKEMASQLGIDIKDNWAILERLDQEFPAYLIVYDHDYSTIRAEIEGFLLWDYPARELSYILGAMKPTLVPAKFRIPRRT